MGDLGPQHCSLRNRLASPSITDHEAAHRPGSLAATWVGGLMVPDSPQRGSGQWHPRPALLLSNRPLRSPAVNGKRCGHSELTLQNLY